MQLYFFLGLWPSKPCTVSVSGSKFNWNAWSGFNKSGSTAPGLYLLDERSRHGLELLLLRQLLNRLLQLRRRLHGLHNDGGRVHSSDHLLLPKVLNCQLTYFYYCTSNNVLKSCLLGVPLSKTFKNKPTKLTTGRRTISLIPNFQKLMSLYTNIKVQNSAADSDDSGFYLRIEYRNHTYRGCCGSGIFIMDPKKNTKLKIILFFYRQRN